MLKLTSVALLALPVLATGAVAADGGQHGPIRINLSGAQEDPTVITDARGTAVLRIQGNTVAYHVRYRNLESDIEQAHIHIGAKDTTGGIAAFLCSDLGNDPTGTAPFVRPRRGSSGCDRCCGCAVGPAIQGVPPGTIADLIEALRKGFAYINIHTVVSPAGEIRGDVPAHD